MEPALQKGVRLVQQTTVKLKNCPICGKTFIGTPAYRVCRDCREKEYQMERTIINYVRDHPGAQPAEIIEETGASEKLLRRMIEEGRFIELGSIRYPCRKCGRLISSGKYCRECYSRMKQSLQKAHADIQSKTEKKKREKEERTYSDGMKETLGSRK